MAGSADLVLTIGAIHGLPEASVEERRAWVLSVLLFGEAASVTFTNLAGELGKGLGAKATAAIPTASHQAINRKLGRTIVTKYGTKRGAAEWSGRFAVSLLEVPGCSPGVRLTIR